MIFTTSFYTTTGYNLGLDVSITVNGVYQPKFETWSLIGPNDTEPAVFSGLIQLNANDVIKIIWRDYDGGAPMVILNMDLDLTRMNL